MQSLKVKIGKILKNRGFTKSEPKASRIVGLKDRTKGFMFAKKFDGHYLLWFQGYFSSKMSDEEVENCLAKAYDVLIEEGLEEYVQKERMRIRLIAE